MTAYNIIHGMQFDAVDEKMHMVFLKMVSLIFAGVNKIDDNRRLAGLRNWHYLY